MYLYIWTAFKYYSNASFLVCILTHFMSLASFYNFMSLASFYNFMSLVSFCNFMSLASFCNFMSLASFCNFMSLAAFCNFMSLVSFCNFMSLVSFYTHCKHQKTRGFPMFAGGIERGQLHEMVKYFPLGISMNSQVLTVS